MSTASTLQLQPLNKKLRGKLEATVKEARDVAEEAARAACTQLEVGQAKVVSLKSDEDKDLRRRLRIHGRQLGDTQSVSGEQQFDRLVEEIAYEHWHRMLFARFLAENQLLMYPDPDGPVSVSLDDCEDLAADEGAKNGWELAALFATKMLPQIFRVDSPVFALTLPPEKQQRLEQLLAALPLEVFTASDSLGWVYQFWQAKRKEEVNASEVKIGARELPAVTQLFTEPYMVSFLLDNSLGAWWASRRLSGEDLQNAQSEQDLRKKASLRSVPLEFLRFVRNENTGRWSPSAGSFEDWPESPVELKTLDPCCGSGHFLVAAMRMLVPMRMELERLSARDAVDRVLSENLHGLEIDQRCVELAAFALALAAWRFPEAGGYRPLPDLNVACCGLSVSVPKEEWTALAGDNDQLRLALNWMYDEFKDAPVLGSLLNPAESLAAKIVKWDALAPLFDTAMQSEGPAESHECSVIAHGLWRASLLLRSKYHCVTTNVPYLSRGKQSPALATFSEQNHFDARHDLATVFLERCLGFCRHHATVNVVVPQGWLFLKRYKEVRKSILNNEQIQLIARLGAGAFEEIGGEVVQVALISISHIADDSDLSERLICSVDLGDCEGVSTKAQALHDAPLMVTSHEQQLANPDSNISTAVVGMSALLANYASALSGISTGELNRFAREFWEVNTTTDDWEFMQSSADQTMPFGGLSGVIYWENERGSLYRHAQSVKHLNHAAQNWLRGKPNWRKRGVCVNKMNNLYATLYTGEIYDENCNAIIPSDESHLAALWCFCSSSDYHRVVREYNQSLLVQTKYLIKIPFDLAHWQQVAAEKYPYGLPEPYSDDPTQWLFHGHPASSEQALQVAIARLVGYRWPGELDECMELATDARTWIERSNELASLADKDGIVCIPAVGTEQPAEDRLRNLLHKSYEQGRAQEQTFRKKLAAADENDPLTVDLLRRGWKPLLPGSFNEWLERLLDAAGHKGKPLGSWLRDKFFTQHCKLFHHRPFIWHIWDGLKDGFSVLVNYHKLDNKLLQTLIYTYLNDWIKTQKNQLGKVDGSQERLDAANALKAKLELILQGESLHDIFVRWKPLEEQPIGWNPDLNDGVRLNIRPWMTVDDVGKRGAGILRDKPNIDWKKDRGKDVESAPWFHLGPDYGGKEGDRINDHHLTLAEKKAVKANGNP